MINRSKFKDAKMSDFDESIKEKVKGVLKDKKGIFIYGNCGTGKTHLLNALYKHSKENFYGEVRYYNFSEFLYFAKNKFQNDFHEDVMNKIMYPDYVNRQRLLFLDDIGSEKTTDWSIETLGLIVNRFYEQEDYLFITSNLNLEEIQERYGDRIASRIAEMCGIIKLEGEDRRVK